MQLNQPAGNFKKGSIEQILNSNEAYKRFLIRLKHDGNFQNNYSKYSLNNT